MKHISELLAKYEPMIKQIKTETVRKSTRRNFYIPLGEAIPKLLEDLSYAKQETPLERLARLSGYKEVK